MLIKSDIRKMQIRYDEALKLQGQPCKYQYPIHPESNAQGEPVIDSYSVPIDTSVFFDSTPKIKTFRRYGWVVENDSSLPFLLHCSFNLPCVQKDALFTFEGLYTNLPERTFRVTEITMDAFCPDHIVCQVVPVYYEQAAGFTKKETEQKYSKSNNFLKPAYNYKGKYAEPSDGDKE